MTTPVSTGTSDSHAARCAIRSSGDAGRAAGLFILLALVFGLALAFITPPMQVPDEGAHFARAYQLSLWQIVPIRDPQRLVNATGGELPADCAEFHRIFEAINFNPEVKIENPLATYRAVHDRFRIDTGRPAFVGFANTAVHSPLIYLPQAVGMMVARWISSSILTIVYAARVANLLFVIALIAAAVWLTPVHRWVFAALALTPMSLFQTASLSSDGVTNGIAFLFLGLIYRAAFGPHPAVSRRLLVGIVATAAALGLTKQMYYPLALAILLVPPARLGGARGRAWACAVVAGATLSTLVVWGAVVRQVYSPILPWVDPIAQLARMFEEPSRFVWAFLRTLVDATALGAYLHEFVGVLGTLDMPLPVWVVVLHYAGLGALAVVDGEVPKSAVGGRSKILAMVIAAVTSLVILVTIYLTWMPVGSESVRLQGRYFIPIGPLALLWLHGLRHRVAESAGAAGVPAWLPRGVAGYFALLLTGTLFLLVRRYYAL